MKTKKINQRKRNSTEDGFKLRVCCSEYVTQRKNDWGSNLVGWIDEKDGKYFACFNVWD